MGCQAEHPMPDLVSTDTVRDASPRDQDQCHDRRVALCCRSLELPYATSRVGKISSLVVKFFIYLVSGGNKTRTRNSSCISGSTKYDRRAYRSSTQTFRGQSAHYCIERISSRSWNDNSILSSSS